VSRSPEQSEGEATKNPVLGKWATWHVKNEILRFAQDDIGKCGFCPNASARRERMRRTKIVCTLGPASQSEETLREMVRAGMDVARINFSYGDHQTHARDIALVRRLAQEAGQVLAVMGDLQGPKLRVGEIATPVTLREGQDFNLTTRPVPGDDQEVNLPHPEVMGDVRPGDRVLLDDGLLELQVLETTPTDLRCRVVTGGPLTSRKGVSLPGVSLSLPSLTEKDQEDAAFAIQQGVDYLALSFVRQAGDVSRLRDLLGQHRASIPIIAKIEKREAVEAFEGVMEASDGAMVARGDLGVETPAEEVPIYQKRIIRLANEVGKPVITATQMLNSMIVSPRPTRAEASDVANAILDGTDAVMLSGETAVGKYPVEAVGMMAKIALTAERILPPEELRILPYRERLHETISEPSFTSTDAISQATCEIALELSAKAIISSTMSGHTARMVAKHRPATPIIAVTPSPETQRRLALVWGVHPLLVSEFAHTDQMIETAVQAALDKGLIEKGDMVVITAGVPLGGPGRTNMLKVHVVE
jgi:pyruvate kinase